LHLLCPKDYAPGKEIKKKKQKTRYNIQAFLPAALSFAGCWISSGPPGKPREAGNGRSGVQRPAGKDSMGKVC